MTAVIDDGPGHTSGQLRHAEACGITASQLN